MAVRNQHPRRLFGLALAALLLVIPAASAKSAEWLTDYKAALETARKTNKVVMADFTGSDWCGFCKKLKAEVLDTPEFKAWADKKVVLLELDYPHSTPQPDDVKAQNADLQKKFNVHGFPTVLFVDATGKELGRQVGYHPGSGKDAWIPAADKIVGNPVPVADPRAEAPAGKSAEWLTDYKAALETAKKTNKVVLADFTGSDWCGFCKVLKKEVLDTPEFKAWADKKVVLLELDFPHSTPLADELKAQNADLQKKFNVHGFPTLVFIDVAGQEIGRQVGYHPGSGKDAWIVAADKIVGNPGSSLTITPLTSLVDAMGTAARAGKPVLLIVDPKGDKGVAALFKDSALAKSARARLVVAHLAGKLDDKNTKALENLAKTRDFKVGDSASILIIDPNPKEKAKMLLGDTPSADVPAPAALLADIRKALPPVTYDGNWTEDFAQAEFLSAELNRPMLLDFTGSDWCPWCQKLDGEIFSTDAFKDYAKASLILVKVDFPQNKKQPDDIAARNQALQEKYSVKGYPTLILVSSDGKVLGQLGYLPGGPDKFMPELKKKLLGAVGPRPVPVGPGGAKP